jgi:crotonobetainyl-CoA:carnitine CoA-transferase CaiB-like acyl-CoA transferase
VSQKRKGRTNKASSRESSWRGLLRDTRVLDLSRYVPGPFCSLLLSELGAEVVKIEEPGRGDPLRSLDEQAFGKLNRSKKSVTLKLRSGSGKSILLRLLERADVLIDGFRPGVMPGLGLGYQELGKKFPRLIYISITGYGQDGPYRDRAGHDINYVAAGGALGTEPPRIQVADFAAGGLYGALALVSALLNRAKTGQGTYLDLAMLDGMVSFLGLAVSSAGELLSGRYPYYGLYPTGDGQYLSVGALEPKFWETFCQAIGRPELTARMNDPTAREEVARTLSSRDLAHWEEVFSGVDACVEPVRDPMTALSHPQVLHRQTAHSELSMPFARAGALEGSAPALGEHTDVILREVGISGNRLKNLRAEGVC